MKWKKALSFVLSILLALLVGFLGSLATQRGLPAYMELTKPPFTPPPAVFPIVWTILYVLMGIGAAIIWNSKSPLRQSALLLYLAQLIVNGLWSFLFFGLQLYCASFVWLVTLWLLVLNMIRLFRRIDPLAGNLQIPYLLWLTLAGYLNLGICVLNR